VELITYWRPERTQKFLSNKHRMWKVEKVKHSGNAPKKSKKINIKSKKTTLTNSQKRREKEIPKATHRDKIVYQLNKLLGF